KALSSACAVIEAVEFGLIRRICIGVSLSGPSRAIWLDEVGNRWRLEDELAVRSNVIVGVKARDRLVAVRIDLTPLFIEAILVHMHMHDLTQNQRAPRIIDQALHPALEGAG